MKVAFIGGGNMASALVGGMLARGQAAEAISVVETLAAQRSKLAERYPGINLFAAAGAGRDRRRTHRGARRQAAADA